MKLKYLCLYVIAIFLFAACSANEEEPPTETPTETPIEIPIETPSQEISEETPPDTPAPPLPCPFAFATVPPNPAPIVTASDIHTPLEINLTEAPEPSPSPWANAEEMVAQMRVGWNLGNTLDAHPHGNTAHFSRSPHQHETTWGNPVTTPETIQTIYNVGFDVIRIPVTWYPRLVYGCDNYTIREDWMNRVIEVVDYAMRPDKFVIINVHHDERLFSLHDYDMERGITAITRLWEQIGYVFRDYPHNLIFEGLNEPRTVGSAAEWNGGTPEERANVNLLNQVFMDTVRAIGGNNTNRMLMVPTYAAAVLNQTVNEFVLPEDSTNEENKLIVSLHMYAPYPFALTLQPHQELFWSADNHGDTSPIIWGLDLAYNNFVSRGIPVIMGEMGALNRDNLNSRVNWTYFFVTEAAARGIPSIWWDNGRFGISRTPADGDHFAIIDRETNTFPFPEIIDALLRATE